MQNQNEIRSCQNFPCTSEKKAKYMEIGKDGSCYCYTCYHKINNELRDLPNSFDKIIDNEQLQKKKQRSRVNIVRCKL